MVGPVEGGGCSGAEIAGLAGLAAVCFGSPPVDPVRSPQEVMESKRNTANQWPHGRKATCGIQLFIMTVQMRFGGQRRVEVGSIARFQLFFDFPP